MPENLVITPAAGDFDVDGVKHWLDARADAFEVAPNVYRIAGSPTHADLLYSKSLAGKTSRGTFVRVQAREILVENEGDPEQSRSVLDFVQWLAAEQEVRFGAGWSDEHVRSIELGWTSQLREIGFFRFLAHGHDTSVSIDEARRDTPLREERELIAYLESGHLYRASDTLAIDEAGEVIGPANLYTDGVYLWPADLPHYVRRAHVRLPRHFMIHAHAQGWRVPSVDIAALPGSENIPRLSSDELAWYAKPALPPAICEGDTCSLAVAHGLATTSTLLRSGAADAVYRGYTGRGTPVLVTFTMRHQDSYDELGRSLSFEREGITPLLHIGEVDPASARGFRDVLVEVEPHGSSILEDAPLPEVAIIRCGIDVAAVLASAHADDIVLGGLAPEVIYLDDTLRFTALTPRSRRFVASVDLQSGGQRSYKLPYSGHEALVLGRSSFEEGDVFALCASLFHAATGKHPFGSELPEILQRIATNAPLPFSGSPALGAILASGLAPDPATRPTPIELATALARLA